MRTHNRIKAAAGITAMLVGATVAPAQASIFDGARVKHHNPDNGWHPPIVVTCQDTGDKLYLYEGQSAKGKGCDDVGHMFVYANSWVVNHTPTGWHTLIVNHGDHGYYLEVHNGVTWNLAVKRAS